MAFLLKHTLLLATAVVVLFPLSPLHAVEESGECHWSNPGDGTCEQTFVDGSLVPSETTRCSADNSSASVISACCCPASKLSKVKPKYIIIAAAIAVIGGLAVLSFTIMKNEPYET